MGLCVEIAKNAGIVSCCSPDLQCHNYVHDLSASCYLESDWCHCQSYPTCPRPLSTSKPDPSCKHPRRACLGYLESICTTQNEVRTSKDEIICSCNCANLQCACSVGASEEILGPRGGDFGPCSTSALPDGADSDLLRNLMMLSNKGKEQDSFLRKDCCLKRVNSEPSPRSKRSDAVQFECHAPLASSRSLDVQKLRKTNPSTKLRLRASSSRHISHHSSSTEEWFEEVPVLSVDQENSNLQLNENQNNFSGNNQMKDIKGKQLIPPPNPELCVNGDKPPPSQDGDAGFRSPSAEIDDFDGSEGTKEKRLLDQKNCIEPQHSLNNLLLTDSCDRLSTMPRHRSESSLSGLYSEDTASYTSRPTKDSETVSQAPTYDVAEVDGVTKKPTKFRNQKKY